MGLSLSAPVAAQRWVHEPVRRDGAIERDDRLLRQTMLAGHNQARAAAGSPPLAWDARLADSARDYARELARTNRFQHSDRGGRVDQQGENLWAGTLSAYTYAEMIGHWLAERRDVRPGVVPRISRSGRFADVAHYVQIVWPATRSFGCAMTGNAQMEYLVCRYAPPGNMIGARLVETSAGSSAGF